MKIYGYCRVSTEKQKLEKQFDNIKSLYPNAVIRSEKYTGTTTDREKWNKLLEEVRKDISNGEKVVIVFDSVSRMSRNAEEGITDYFTLYNMGVDLVFLGERHIDTQAYKKALETARIPFVSDGSSGGDLVSDILAAVNRFMKAKASDDIREAFRQAEKEVVDKKRWTKEGIRQQQKKNELIMSMHPDDYMNQEDYRQIGQPKGARLTTKKELALKQLILEYSKSFNGTLKDDEVIALINGMAEIPTVDGKGTVKPKDMSKVAIIKDQEGRIIKKRHAKNKFINRQTYYKYKKELKEQQA